MEMAAAVAVLPGTTGHSFSATFSADKSSSPTSPKPVVRVSLLLRGPDKPYHAVNHNKPESEVPSKKNKSCLTALVTNANSRAQKIGNDNDITEKRTNGRTVAPTCTTSDVLQLMDALCLPVPLDMYASFVKECTVSANSFEADDLHRHITQAGLQRPSVSLLNRLLLMHVSHNRLGVARGLFDEMPFKDFKSWAIMVVAYANRADYQEATSLFMKMLHFVSMLEFPAWIMVCLLKMCMCTTNVDFGKQVHACSVKLGHTNNSFLATCLINLYGKFSCFGSANVVFNQVPRQSVQTWIARLINNSREKRFFEVFRDFKEIGEAGIKKNALMFSCALKACARMHDNGQSGRQVHANAVKLGFESDEYVQCGLVNMYGRNGLLGDAKRVLHINGEGRNNACWNAMLRGYIRNGFYIEAIKFIYEMKAAGVQLQQSLLDELRIACGSNSLEKLHLVNGALIS